LDIEVVGLALGALQDDTALSSESESDDQTVHVHISRLRECKPALCMPRSNMSDLTHKCAFL